MSGGPVSSWSTTSRSDARRLGRSVCKTLTAVTEPTAVTIWSAQASFEFFWTVRYMHDVYICSHLSKINYLQRLEDTQVRYTLVKYTLEKYTLEKYTVEKYTLEKYTLEKIYFGKVHFQGIHFDKIHLGKIHYGKLDF